MSSPTSQLVSLDVDTLECVVGGITYSLDGEYYDPSWDADGNGSLSDQEKTLRFVANAGNRLPPVPRSGGGLQP